MLTLSSTEGVSTARAMKDSCVTKTGTFLRARDLDTMFSGLVTTIRAVGCPSHFRGTRQSALSSEHRNQRLFLRQAQTAADICRHEILHLYRTKLTLISALS